MGKIFGMKVVVTLFLFLVSTTAAADWDVTFGGEGGESGQCVRQTSDGGYIIAGSTSSYGAGSSDVWLIKTDSDGTKQWDQTFGGTGIERGYSVRQTSDGGYIVTGETSSYGAGQTDVWLIKTDAGGTIQWDQTFGGTDYDSGFSVEQTADGGYVVAGNVNSDGLSYSGDACLIRTDADGIELWNRTFGEPETDTIARSVQQTPDGGFIFTGYIHTYTGTTRGDMWLVKTDADGILQWDQAYGDDHSEWGYEIQQTSDNGYLIGGYKYSYVSHTNDVWLVKTNSNGVMQWDQAFGGSLDDWGLSMDLTADGGCVIAGTTMSYGAGGTDFWLIKADPDGIEQWNQTFGGTGWDWGRSVQQTTDGGYILTGEIEPIEGGGSDIWLIKVESSELSTITLQSPADGAVLTSPPTFSWTADAGANNVFAVDLSLNPAFLGYWSTHKNLHQLIAAENWAMPQSLWNFIPSGSYVYWRVRGADLDVTPLTIITSDEVWGFSKQ